MISIKQWRATNESTGPAITAAPEEHTEPDEKDWAFYHTRIQGKAKTYLGWFVDEIHKKTLNLPRKGFILQEIIGPDGLNMTVQEVVRAITNIKHALAKNATMQQPAQAQSQPASQPAAPAAPVAQAKQPETDFNMAAK